MNEQMTDFEHKARDIFDASVESLDAETRSRLNRARQAAVAGREPARAPAWRSWAPAGAVAAALVAAVLWRFPGTGDSQQVQINGEAPIEIVELAAEGEDFELMIEDPEFYSWVADQARANSPSAGGPPSVTGSSPADSWARIAASMRAFRGASAGSGGRGRAPSNVVNIEAAA